jgi:hypothetical protein
MVQILIVVPWNLRAAAEAAVAGLDPTSVGPTFTIQLNATGSGSPTFAACQPNVRESTWSQIQQLAASPAFSGSSVFAAADAADHLPMISRSLESLGLVQIEGE